MPATSSGFAAVSARRAALAGGRPGLGAAPAYYNRDVFQASPDDLPAIDIHSL
jgi:hypothetical protein